MSLGRHSVHETTQNVFEDDDLTDDSTGVTPMIGLKMLHRLRDRFLLKLCKVTSASAKAQESANLQSIKIYLNRIDGSDQVRIELDTELKLFIARVGCHGRHRNA